MKLPLAALAGALGLPGLALAVNVVTIGDSLTAEYDTLPDVPGFPTEATAYAEVTVKGWESLSWVEVLGRVQKSFYSFGGARPLSAPWAPPRLSGFEYNWGIPGIEAGQYEDFVTSSAFENFLYFTLRQSLESQLKSKAQRVVIWLGGNEFRANYGRLYDGGSSEELIDGLLEDLEKIVDFVKSKNSKLQIVLCNVPDLGATPAKKAAHPDPLLRARVTSATQAANVRIARLAEKKRIGLADMFSLTDRLVRGSEIYLGAVQIVNDKDEDNDPHYAFTRDGLHANTALQIFNTRSIAVAFYQKYKVGIPLISDSAALKLLGIDPNEPFYDWLASYGIANRSFVADTEGDGVGQLIEYTFGLDPTQDDAEDLAVTIGGPIPGIVGTKSVEVTPDPARVRHVRTIVQYSTNAVTWLDVPAKNVVKKADGASISVIPLTTGPSFQRLKVSLIPPSGSTITVSSALRFE